MDRLALLSGMALGASASSGATVVELHIRMVLYNKGELLLTWLLYLLFLIIMGSKSGSGALLAIL